jgi:hypothetical protein
VRVSGAFLALAVLIVLGVSGIGIVLCVTRARLTPVSLAFESIAIGLLVQEFIGFVALRANHYSLLTVSVLTLIVVVGSAVTVRARRRSVHTSDPPDTSTRGRGSARISASAALVGAAWVGVVVAALLVRQGPSYFLYQTGDMGEYVNDANILINRHFLNGSFPHGFTLFLSGTHLLLGRAHTVAGLPALGILLVLGTAAYARVSRLRPLAALGIAALVALHPVTVWFSLFPVSESLYPVLLIAVLYFVAQARSQHSYSYAVVAGLVLGAMLLVRGNAMLLAPIIVVGLLASAAVDDERTVRVQRAFTVAGLLALSGAYMYDLNYVRAYFVQIQLGEILPHRLFRIADKASLFDVSFQLVLAVVLSIAIVVGATNLVTRYVRPRVVDHPVVFWRSAYGIVIGLTVVILAFMHHAGLKDALIRWGPVLVLLTLAGVIGVVMRPGRYLDGASAWLLLLVVCTYSVLFASRVPTSRPHAYYLYWDRYLFSEVMPAALVFAAVSLHILVDSFVSATRSRTLTRVAIAGLSVIAALGFVPNLRETHRITRFPLFGSIYETLDRLDALTRTEGRGVIVYSAPEAIPPGWFFPNTFRAIPLPLLQSFRRVVVGLPTGAFARDPHFDPASARAELKKYHLDKGYLISLRAPGAARYADDTRTHYVGSVSYVSPTLHRTVLRSAPNWVLVPFLFDVYALS